MDTPADQVLKLMAEIPRVVGEMTGHESGCLCARCDAATKRMLRVAQHDIDARVALERLCVLTQSAEFGPRPKTA